MATQRVELEIEGMSCGGCVKAATRALQAVPGVLKAEVVLETRRAHVEAAGELAPTSLVDAIAGAGFQARVVQA